MDTETKHLPQDLAIEILLRLPVKSLIRFKCVCKFWRSLISDPHFVRSHFELATPRLLFNAGLGIQTLDFDDGSLHSNPISEVIFFDFLPTAAHIRIVGSCRGWLLLLTMGNATLYLWNPSTHAHKPIPSSYFRTDRPGYLYGFGYDSSQDDYLVVQVAACNYLAPGLFFSVRANMWKYTEGTRLNLSSRDLSHGLLFNEVIHWLVYDHDKSMDVIIAFDLMERRLLEIPLSDYLARNLSSCILGVHGRFLSLSVMGIDTIEIWTMEAYQVQSSWTKAIVMNIPSKFLSPLLSTESGDIVMRRTIGAGLVKYSDKGEQLEHLEHRRHDLYLESQVPMYRESMFSLHGSGE